MKVLTFSAIKGGVGKTTLAFNYGEWLAERNSSSIYGLTPPKQFEPNV